MKASAAASLPEELIPLSVNGTPFAKKNLIKIQRDFGKNHFVPKIGNRIDA